jgi:hypothetical protein
MPLTPLQYVVGQRASHDLRRRLLQPDKTRTKPSDIGNRCSAQSQSMPSAPIDVEPTESDRKPHLAECVVLLLQPLQAALLGHGETLTPARTAAAPDETLAQSSHSQARGRPIGDPQLRTIIQSGPFPPTIGWGRSSPGANWGLRRLGFGGIGRRGRGGEGIGDGSAAAFPTARGGRKQAPSGCRVVVYEVGIFFPKRVFNGA